MNYRMLRYLLGCILLIEAILMSLPLAVSLISHEDVMPFVYTIAILLVISLPCVLLKPKNTQIYAREGFVCVGAAWILLSVFGALPFISTVRSPIPAMRSLKQFRALPPQEQLFCLPLSICRAVFFSGVALLTGSAAWAYWCLCLPFCPAQAARRFT